MSTRDPRGIATQLASLATATMPRRVHRILEKVFALLSEEIANDLERLLVEFEHELFRLGERARNPALQGGYMDTLRTIRLHRSDLIPQFLVNLEDGLARVREPAPLTDPDETGAPPLPLSLHDLRLVDEHETSEDNALRMIAVRHEARSGLPLLLLGQRFGVLAAAPAFESERLPVGPQRLCRLLAESSRVLHINSEARQLLFRLYDRQLTANYPHLVEATNVLLARENVLPGLTHVPLRLRPTRQDHEDAEPSIQPDTSRREPAAATAPAGVARRGGGQEGSAETAAHPDTRATHDLDEGSSGHQTPRAYTAWPGQAGRQDQASSGDAGDFSMLQELLANRRSLVGKFRAPDKPDQPVKQHPVMPTQEVISALGALQSSPPAPHGPPRTVPDIRQSLLAQGRQMTGSAIALTSEDSDTFELLGMLYTQVGRELREGTVSNELLAKLQVPLLRMALQDRDFFLQQQHPARELLNAVAEAGAKWMGDDEVDLKFNEQLQSAVEHVVDNYDGDTAVFDAANQQLQLHLQAMARKAEISERRHVEAARGKEKLEVAKQRASEVIEAALSGHKLPRFLQTLLRQAWADVLTLVLLRDGDGSQEWREHEQATRQLIVFSDSDDKVAPSGLAEQVEQALKTVGYHAGEASEIARRLTSRLEDEEDDPASRTELAVRLKARARLGDETTTAANPAPALPKRNDREQECYEHLRSLPFGTWIEFVTNQQGDVLRRRLAWYSTVTGNALFVNQRGQRVDEHSLDHLARTMAKAQLRVVTKERGRLVDRAWQAALSTLRNFGSSTKDQNLASEGVT